MNPTKSRLAATVLLAVSFLVLYYGVAARLVQDWINDDNYSHGFLIVPLAAYFAWERRDRLMAVMNRPSIWGLPIVLASVGVLFAGFLGAELFLTRISIIGVLAGGIVFLLGWRALRTLTFPLAFLLLMIPIPAIIFNQIAFPLQLLASRVGEVTLDALQIPVLREGNVIILAHTSLEVAEACSGIRSLISLLTLGLVYGYFMDPRGGVRVAIAASTIPIAIIANALRVAGTGVAAHHFGAEAAQGFFHTFSGWLVFVVAFSMLFVVASVILRVARPPRAPAPVTAAVS